MCNIMGVASIVCPSHLQGEVEEEEPRFSKDPSDVLQPKRPVWEDEDDQEIR